MSIAGRQLRNAYDPFALIYNRDIAETFCERAWPAIERLLLSRVPGESRVLDLCCGSGQMARELTRCGHRVIGLDGSEAMLRIAKENAPQADFVLGDARDFTFSSPFDAVLSSFNSFAHAINTEELEAILRNARAALRGGGAMLFDLSMEEQYISKWRGSFGEVHEDVAWIVRASFDRKEQAARNDITVFRRDNYSQWQREDFVFQQHCYLESQTRAALSNAGFTHVESFDAARDLEIAKESGRRFFLCL